MNIIGLLKRVAAIACVLAVPASADSPRLIRIAARVQADPPDPKSFKVEFDRGEAKIARVLTPADPQLLLIVLDLVGDLGAIEPAKVAAAAAIEKLPANAYVGIIRAQDGMNVLVDPTADRAAVTAAVRDLPISGRPGLLEAMDPVERMADTIARKAQVRVAVLYITDSDVHEYREDFTNPVINSSDPNDLSRRFPETLIQEKMSKIASTFAAYQTPLHVVHLAYRSDRLNEAYRNGLQRLAELTAGSAVFCRSRAEIGDAIATAFGTIVSEYSVVVAAPERMPDTVQIRMTAGDAPLVYRTRLKLKEK